MALDKDKLDQPLGIVIAGNMIRDAERGLDQ
jgi:hypothetical protein